VSIHAVIQNPINDRNKVDFVITTEEVALSQIKDFADRIAGMRWALNKPLYMPILL
jgi:hypothetical protein